MLRFSRRPLLLWLLIAAVPPAHAEGNPPLITDDPGTPGNGHWEINLGLSTERRPGFRRAEQPLLDLNYGIGDRLQLKYEVPYLSTQEDGGPTVAGLGNSEVGAKWRFLDHGEHGLAISVYPQLEFNNPGSASGDHGVVEHGSAFLLPFQFEQDAGPVTMIWQLGREFRSDGDTWFYGISASHRLTEKLEVAVEIVGEASARFDRSQLTANLGVAIDCSERTSLLFSVGRELRNPDEPRATFVGYLGLQWRL